MAYSELWEAHLRHLFPDGAPRRSFDSDKQIWENALIDFFDNTELEGELLFRFDADNHLILRSYRSTETMDSEEFPPPTYKAITIRKAILEALRAEGYSDYSSERQIGTLGEGANQDSVILEEQAALDVTMMIREPKGAKRFADIVFNKINQDVSRPGR